MIDFAKLQEPFPPEGIEWRLQQAGKKGEKFWAKCLAYVTNRAIQQRLDDVCGPENWRNEFAPAPCGGIMCGISILVPRDGPFGNEWVTKWDGAENTDVEAVKGGLSGSMKRAAVQWGIGRYLYDLEEGWAQIHEKGRFQGSTKDRERFRWDPPTLPAWALPPTRGKEASDAQLELIQNLMRSHVISDTERAGIAKRLGNGMDAKQASDCVEWLQTTITARKAEEKDGAS